jgi:hypothetical protein
MEFIKSNGRELQQGAWWDQVEGGSRESLSLFHVFLKLMLTYGKGRTWGS